MCGRYELHSQPAAIALAFGLAEIPALAARYNIAPMQRVPIVRRNAQGANELVDVRWGFVPRRAKDPSIGVRMINARAETVARRPAFRNAFDRHRCLLPAYGFYEWLTSSQRKRPVHVGMRGGTLFGMAGLCERWLSEDGEVLDTCCIITTAANAMLRDVHDRMPAIIAPEDYDRWLDPANADASDLLVPFTGDAMTWRSVSSRVNAVLNDDASLIEPASQTDLFEGDPSADDERIPVQASLL